MNDNRYLAQSIAKHISRVDVCTCPKCQPVQMPLLAADVAPVPDLIFFGRYYKRPPKLSPPATKAANESASGAGVFCNGSSAAPIQKGRN